MKYHLVLAILFSFSFSLIFAESFLANVATNSDSVFEELKSVERKKRPYGIFGHAVGYGVGFHALAILYWLKVKAIIIAFIVGTAIVWGSRYIWAHKSCPKETVHEGAIIPFDHGPIWSGGHDHIPYSSSFSFSSHDHDHEHDPYHAYSSSSYLDSPPTASGTEHYPTEKKWRRRGARQLETFETEDQITEMFFYFLGVGSTACRKRFVCEWEFKSQRHPMTRMAFRIFGRGLFKKYARDPTDTTSGITKFQDCGRVHHECTFIEEDEIEPETNEESENEYQADDENEIEIVNNNDVNDENENNNNSVSNGSKTEVVNNSDLKIERKNPLAEAIFSRSNKSNKRS